MKSLTTIPESFKTAGRVLFNGQGTASADTKGFKPGGTNGLTIFSIVTMANAANLTLSVKTADDADGANSVDISEDVYIYVDDVRQDNGKSYEITDNTGVFTVSFCVDPLLIPDGKFLCLENSASNALNVISSLIIDDVIHNTSK